MCSDAAFLREIVGQSETDDPPRDYLTEAIGIISGRSMYLPERAHLVALWAQMTAEIKRLQEKEAINGNGSQGR